MGLDLKAPENVILKPVITVLGVGGAGGNAVNNMIKAKLKGANFVVANTDAQALSYSESSHKIQLGEKSTKGLGAGASPKTGKDAATESENDIRSHLEGSNMLFITAGMGGGTGTGASPEIAKIARELGILTVGVVTKPFLFEGEKRMEIAEQGLAELQQYVDTLIIIPNQNLFRIANESTTFQEAFEIADDVLHAGVRSVTDLITAPGLVNLDFADIETIMREKGKAMMGTGEGTGEDRAIKAAESAIANPLLDQTSMCGACGVLINITGGKDITLYEVDSAANRIREEVGDSDANIIFGSTFNPDLEGTIRVSVVATGIEQNSTAVLSTASNLKEDSISEIIEQENIAVNNKNHDSVEDNTNNILLDNNSNIKDHDNNKIAQPEQWAQPNVNTMIDKPISVKPKRQQSLLKRMWNSLKSNDVDYKLNSQDDHSNHVMTSGQNSQSDIQEVPSFIRKER